MNEISMMYQADRDNCSVALASDASGSCGTFCSEAWFQLQWLDSIQDYQITVKELIPIVLTAAVWGKDWYGKNVIAHCDNAAVVPVISKGDSRDPDVTYLMRCLTFVKSKFQFTLFTSHIRGAKTNLADALSRDNLQYFRFHHPQAWASPTPLLPQLLDLAIMMKPDWTSKLWRALWTTTFGQDQHLQLNALTTGQNNLCEQAQCNPSQ